LNNLHRKLKRFPNLSSLKKQFSFSIENKKKTEIKLIIQILSKPCHIVKTNCGEKYETIAWDFFNKFQLSKIDEIFFIRKNLNSIFILFFSLAVLDEYLFFGKGDHKILSRLHSMAICCFDVYIEEKFLTFNLIFFERKNIKILRHHRIHQKFFI
jgi:hypothetical protein